MDRRNSKIMILAVDVHYREVEAKAVGITFPEWESERISETYIAYISEVEKYVPGSFYQRELPCILELLKQVDLNLIDIMVVDGHVFLDKSGKLGLGGHLFHALEGTMPVIGVAKNPFKDPSPEVKAVLRGDSQNPLHISSMGIASDTAANNIRIMRGPYRIPSLLKLLDQVTKEH